MKQSGRELYYWSGTAKYFAVITRLQMFLNAFHASQQADEIHSPLLFWQDMTLLVCDCTNLITVKNSQVLIKDAG